NSSPTFSYSILSLFHSRHAVSIFHSFFFIFPRPPISTLFPYTTLFRSKPFFVPFGAVVYSVINIKLGEHIVALCSPNLILITLGRAVQQECRDRSRMPSSA